MSLFRIVLVLALGFFTVAAEQAQQVTSKEVFDRADKVVNDANSLLKRSEIVLGLYKNSVENFKTANAGVASFTASTVNYYDSLKKKYDALPSLIKKYVEFAPISTFLTGLVKLVESFVPLSDYLDKGQRLLIATKKIADVLTTRIGAELIEANNGLTTAEQEKKKIDTALAEVQANLATLREAVATFEAAEKAAQSTGGLPVPAELIAKRDKASADKNKALTGANAQLLKAEEIVATAAGVLQKAESTVQPMNDTSKSVLALSRDSQEQLSSLVAIMQKDSDEYVAMAEGYLKTVNGYTSWLNKGTLGVVPGIIEISGINTKKKELKPLPLFGEAPVKAYEKFAETFVLKPGAGKAADVYANDAAYLKTQIPVADTALKGLVAEATALPGKAKQVINENLAAIKKLQPIDLTLSGKWLGIPFEKYRFFDTQIGASRCFSRYMVMPSGLNLGVVELKDLILFNTSCELITIAELNDTDVSNDFGEKTMMRAGQFYKAKMSYSQETINFVKNVPLLKDIFKSGSIPVSGELLNVGPGKFLGTQIAVTVNQNIDIFAGFNKAIDIFNKKAGGSNQLTTAFTAINTAIENVKKAFKLKLTSFGAAVVENALIPGTPKIVFPVKGTIDLVLGADFKPTIAMGMVFDPAPEKLSGTLSGVWEGSWNNALGLPGLTLSKLGVSTTIGVKGGVTGVGLTAKAKLGSKDLAVTGNVDFASPQDTAYIIEFEKGFLLTDIITMGATLAGMPDVSKYISSLPNVALNKCKLAFIPREMMLFGEMQKAGITLTGTVSILGKEATIFVNFSNNGFYGDVSLDAINLILVKLEGLTDTKLKFAISGGQAGKPNGFYCDAKISIAVPPFGNLAKVKGTVYLVPSFIRITGLEATLGDLGKAVLDVSAGWDFNNFPTKLDKVPWNFKAVLTKDAAGSLAGSFKKAFDKMGECLK